MITVLLCLLCLPILPLAAVVTDTKPQCVKLLTNCVGTLRQFKHREMSDLDNILQPPYKHPQAVAGDLDNDNDIDLCIGIWHEGAGFGKILYFKNTGDFQKPIWEEQNGDKNPFLDIEEKRPAPLLLDVDNDSDLDLILGNRKGTIQYYLNTGTPSNPVYVKKIGINNPFNEIKMTSDSSPTAGDFDNDGDQDLVVGSGNALLYYFKNIGTLTNPVYIPQIGTNNPFNGIKVLG